MIQRIELRNKSAASTLYLRVKMALKGGFNENVGQLHSDYRWGQRNWF